MSPLVQIMAGRQTTTIWTNIALVYWRIYASLGFDEQTTSHYRKQNGLVNRLNRVFMHR